MSVFNRFPPVRGVLQEKVSLSKKSRFGVGGIADILFVPEDMDDLIMFLRNIPADEQITILGAMSNVLVRDGGIRGIVIILGDWFKKVFVEDNILEVGAGVQCSKLSTIAMDHELGGFEFLMGLPGTVGGAIKMNAGCFGSEISNVLFECEAVTSKGQIKWLKSKDIKFGYRTSGIPDDLIITRAWFKGVPNVKSSIPKKVKEIVDKRRESQPLEKKSCGSSFKNPENKKAWELIDSAGCRGMKVGGAMVSEKHCNFLINDGGATAEDIEQLGEKIIKQVLEKTGVQLEWEIIRLGEKSGNAQN
ncbi:MAG: UDP-N-acetylmuramate dehydrogenase [Alphaproteobacteria bacterium]|nr:UDP-N-acetylmuramate dehydrogenase [Alphaproteobacteria bacterium]